MIITKEIFLYFPLVFQVQLGNMGKRKEMTRDFSSLTWFSKLKWLKCQPDMGTITARSLCKCVCMHVQSSPTLCDPMDYSPPLSTELSKQEYWSGLPVATPGVLPDPGIKAVSLVSPASAGRFFTNSATWEAGFT